MPYSTGNFVACYACKHVRVYRVYCLNYILNERKLNGKDSDDSDFVNSALQRNRIFKESIWNIENL